jgi:simple sugar transport system ATP-binding protein
MSAPQGTAAERAVPAPGTAPIAALRGVSKRFPGTLALDAVTLDFLPGEVHVLLGENGAGKSTLVGLMAGMQQPDEGSILIDAVPTRIHSPRHSMSLGIGTVFQQLLLVPGLSVLENLMLGGGAGIRPLASAASRRRFEELSGLLGVAIDPQARVGALSLGEQQQIEIMRALWRHERLLLLDEPTSMLTPRGVEDLGRMLGRLREQGVALLLITHKLPEAFRFGDRISVLRSGRLAGQIGPDELRSMDGSQRTAAALALMFGAASAAPAGLGMLGGPHEASARAGVSRPDPSQPPVLTVRALSTSGGRGQTALKHVSLTLWPGQILGIAGVDGNGQQHLAEALAGQRAATHGSIEFRGEDVTRGRVPERRQRGIRYVTDDRLGEGTVRTFSVAINLLLKDIGAPPFWRSGITDWAGIHRHARQQIAQHDVRTPSERTPIGKLSGGNIQKVLLARELDADASVVVLNKPTYGLDLQNQRLALQRIAAAAARGVAVIVISTDLDELLEISDRIGVLYQGRLAGIVDNEAGADQHIGRLMTGASAA